MVLLCVRGAVAQGNRSTGPANVTDVSPATVTLNSTKTLRVGIVQMHSLDHDIEGNLKHATTLADGAAARGAKLILFPELMPTGSYMYFDTWDAAEPTHGKTVQWLKATARRLDIWLGAGFLEADGADFYDTFVLATPKGEEAGRVRKQIPAQGEAYFFRGYAGPHVIETPIGRIGVGICAENFYCFLASEMRTQSADIILMPHSAVDMSESGGLSSPPGTHLALWYARKLGVPVAMVNKVGRSYKPPPNEIKGFFPGLSAIVDSDGTVLQSMDDKEGIGIADVTMDPNRKTGTGTVCTGIGIAELTIGGRAGAGEVAESQNQGHESYENNPFRKAKALAISGAKSAAPADPERLKNSIPPQQ
jgi:N-carbamoylputrescine amidase